jgi:translation initiation factor IF-2
VLGITEQALKSVRRNGNPVPTVRKVIREQPRTETRSQSIPVANPSVSSASKPSPLLLSKPSVAQPPRRPIKSDTSKEKKGPILIDKFASKWAAVDPIVPKELLDPYSIIFMFMSNDFYLNCISLFLLQNIH